MQSKKVLLIGSYSPENEGKPEIIDRDYYRQGWIFKDDKIASLREQVKKLEDDKKKLIVQLVDYEELKSENERLKKQLAKK